jgi:hypothetical protein
MDSNSNDSQEFSDNERSDSYKSDITLTDLPEECLRLVLSHLPIVDKFRYERVCKLWQNIIFDLQFSLRFTKLSHNRSPNYCCCADHKVTNDDWIPQLMTFSSRTRQSPINISVLECVLQKCGQSIKSINLDLALINEEVFEVIAKYCPLLCCLSLCSSTGITDECLQIIATNYGPRLSHINLQCAANRQIYFTTKGLSQFLNYCPNISVLFLASIRSQKSYRLSGDHLNLLKNIDFLSAHLPDVTIEGLVRFAELNGSTKLTKLIIDGIIYSETSINYMIEVLSMFSNLKSLTLLTNCEFPIDRDLITLAKSLLNLEELHLKVNEITVSTIEALSYFSNLKVLEFGLWKPFETGLLTLSLSPLQFCKELTELRLNNLLLSDLLLENIHIFCPNLKKIYLNNMFDCTDDSLRSLSKCEKLKVIRLLGVPNIASEITENGIIHLLDTMSQLVFLEIPIIFELTDDLISCFKQFSKKNPQNYLTFVCEAKSTDIDLNKVNNNHKFKIITKVYHQVLFV